MKRRKNKATGSEIYPGGKHTFPSGGHQPTRKGQPKMCVQSFGIKVRRTRPPGISRNTIDTWFKVVMFIILEIMNALVFFHIVDNTFDSSNFPDDIRGFLKLFQVFMFLFFTYAGILATFFKVNIFQ